MSATTCIAERLPAAMPAARAPMATIGRTWKRTSSRRSAGLRAAPMDRRARQSRDLPLRRRGYFGCSIRHGSNHGGPDAAPCVERIRITVTLAAQLHRPRLERCRRCLSVRSCPLCGGIRVDETEARHVAAHPSPGRLRSATPHRQRHPAGGAGELERQAADGIALALAGHIHVVEVLSSTDKRSPQSCSVPAARSSPARSRTISGETIAGRGWPMAVPTTASARDAEPRERQDCGRDLRDTNSAKLFGCKIGGGESPAITSG